MSQVTLIICALIVFSSCKSREDTQLASENSGTEVFTLKGHRIYRFICIAGETPPNCKNWDFQEMDELLESHVDYASYRIVAPALRDIESATKDIANVKEAMEKETRAFQKKGMQARIDVQETAILKFREVVKKNPKGEDLYAMLDGIGGSFFYPKSQSYQKIAEILKEFRGQDWSLWLDAGDWFTCALSAASKPICWGRSENGQINGPQEMLPLKMISAGSKDTCALARGGDPICWGYSWGGVTTGHEEKVKPNMLPLKMITTGDFHSCALTVKGEPICWGANKVGQRDGYLEKLRPEMLPLKMISSGSAHTCAITRKGDPVCWGNNQLGQSDGHKEKLEPEMLPLKMISSGEGHTCALTHNGEPICWGDDAYEQSEGHKKEIKPTMLPLKQISSGYSHTCALTHNGEPICWGSDGFGRSKGHKEIVKPDMLPLKMISVTMHSCALTALGRIICWGSDDFGAVTGRTREGYKRDRNVPEDVDLSFEAFYYGDD